MSQEWLENIMRDFKFDFEKADKDKSGSLSFTEVMAILKSKGYKGSYDDIMAFFKHFDKDGSDTITQDEYIKVLEKLSKTTLKEFALRKVFTALDVDRNGFISAPEVRYAITSKKEAKDLSQDTVDQVLTALSKDDDGKLNYEEFLLNFKIDTGAIEMRQLFKRLDTDESGHLTDKEISQALQSSFELELPMNKINDLLKNLKKDADGKFSYEEFIQVWMRQEGQVKASK